MEIFVHQRSNKTEFINVDPAKTVGNFGAECQGNGALVWLEGSDEPLEPDKTLTEAGMIERCHVHVSCCKAVAVKIRFNDDSVEDSFPPVATADTILKWAASPEGFKLTDSQAAKHLLVDCETKKELDQAEHIGLFADNDCSVCLDLVPKERFAG